MFGADSIDLNLYSAVTGTNRHYDTAAALDEDTMNARIWLGLHFRKADDRGQPARSRRGRLATSEYFQPTG